MIGLALVVFVTVFANGLRASIADLIDRTLAGDIAVLHDDGFSPDPGRGRADGGEGAGRRRPSRRSATRRRRSRASAARSSRTRSSPTTVGSVYNFDWQKGSDETLASSATTASCSRRTRPTKGDFKVGDQHRRHRPERQRHADRARHLQGQRAARGHHDDRRAVRPHRRPEARLERARQDRQGRQRARGAEARHAGDRRLPRGARPLAGPAQEGERRPGQPAARRCSTRCWR